MDLVVKRHQERTTTKLFSVDLEIKIDLLEEMNQIRIRVACLVSARNKNQYLPQHGPQVKGELDSIPT